jgi:hypothetical protein
MGKDLWLRAIFGKTWDRICGKHLRWQRTLNAANSNEPKAL